MKPAARIAAAIDILDGVLAGAPAEKLLTTWGRQNRFAGSKDRAAIRDHVFDALRCRRSFAALGGRETGRGLMLGALRAAGVDPAEVFSGEAYAPPPLSDAEQALTVTPADLPENVALDCPDWLAPLLRGSLGPDFAPVMQALRQRAPVFLRVNLRRGTRDEAMQTLAQEGITTTPHPLSPTALEVRTNPRRVQTSAAYASGLVELQDAASQAVVDMLPVAAVQRVLDYCAGGGGKTLAMAARADARFFAHDAQPRRMRDLPARAARAGVSVTMLAPDEPEAAAPFDLVLCDVPCSGSGAWRRSPEGKWMLQESDMAQLLAVQSEILDRAAPLVGPDGHLAYATCSILDAENGDQISAFLARTPGWKQIASRRLTPLDGGDGFFVAVLRRG
ncbi:MULTISPECIES: RsmB/NOP family class I SAM-dependent RNA methyltransferase [Actibacterium]|uniref:16S rRNA (Cytosine967-C5)-methyltransferase n=1 Tax=Actibacterium naphthalenivorans TaxID=1614693 RepID=A0A840CJJ7_9RHOB|nr:MULTISPECIES: RsmB/NOP family class I SAM-dependent RNA methyltransferase [Actibacterium]ALG90354.1 SAM-dependent methlyltransferase [Actibacterium sp. EMB200-NS6]MBB4022277.1 16S rRNA (cytosine967-C5)-methyltransferase [Actibacterium naphthalenivorans]